MSEMPPYLIPKEDVEKSENNETEPTNDLTDWDLPLSFDSLRHIEPIEGAKHIEHSWRLKEKYKTHCVALVLCLNVGVDPPDIVKTQPCARLECWIDPVSLSPAKALESIGNNLQSQYERWQPRARYKQSLDPTSEEVKKLCCSLRRNAKDERVLFHYNGHGVPKPTSQGEIWVFNRAYTQYIPLSVYDLQTWMGAPSLYVYDCSNAGVIVEQFKVFAEQHERDYKMALAKIVPSQEDVPLPSPPSYKNCIQLAACETGQTLPMNPELPADLFTCCLTTPVKMAMKWFVLRNHTAKITPSGVADLIDKIPGQVTDRRTMLGELNWIFTAITDTIAWNSLSPDLFQQLFRADLLTASLCRNFLLADRIMRSYNCTPVSSPALPSLASHPMWQAWDHSLDLALAQLPDMLGDNPVPYKHSPFFQEQLTAFQVWLDLGSPRRPPPDQLPMVLQVLLSTMHRVRALDTLCRFLALGGWAVRAVLAVGIFPYMVKLLQASARELRASMVYIWAKIMAVDGSCQMDLVNAKGHRYFLSVLQDTTLESGHRTLAAFVLAGIVDNYPPGQEAALQGSLISICLEQLNDPHPVLRQWLAICLGRLWKDYDSARWSGVRDLAHEKLYTLLEDAHPEVRAAATFALGTFTAQCGRNRSDHANTIDQQVAVTVAKRAPNESCPLVRQEILAALQWLVLTFEQNFVAVSAQERSLNSNQRGSSRDRRLYSSGVVESAREAAIALVEGGALQRAAHGGSAERIKRVSSQNCISSMPTYGFVSVYMKLWMTLVSMCQDPHPQVSNMANEIVNYIRNQLEVSFNREYAEPRGSSTSLPPSPNTRGGAAYMAGDHHNASKTLPPLGTRNRSKAHLPNTISEDVAAMTTSTSPSRDDHHYGNRSPNGQNMRKPIVTTQFVQWASSQFARCTIDEEWHKDEESRLFQERKWRYNRNKSLRKEAKELKRIPVARLESQVFNARSPRPPSVIMFHPYDQHIAVAAKDNFGIWDWGTGAKLCNGQWKRPSGRVSTMDYANAHDQSLLIVGSACGSAGIFRPMQSSPSAPTGTIRSGSSAPASGRDPQLVSAWQALDVRQVYAPSPPQAKQTSSSASAGFSATVASLTSSAPTQPAPNPVGPGMLLCWHQRSSTLAAAGDARALRLWDAHAEVKALDIATDTESGAWCVSRDKHWLVCAGFADGACRVWDVRTPARPVAAHLDHQAPLLCAHLRHEKRMLVTGCVSGEIRFYDLRKHSMISNIQTTPGMTAMSVHDHVDIYACGSSNQYIGVYNMDGVALNTIKFHEGFMGFRIGPVSCLAFHPLRCSLAVGARDSTVSVYSSDPRR